MSSSRTRNSCAGKYSALRSKLSPASYISLVITAICVAGFLASEDKKVGIAAAFFALHFIACEFVDYGFLYARENNLKNGRPGKDWTKELERQQWYNPYKQMVRILRFGL
ncbi:MAG: hypothetical protein WC464_01360 [Bdellovibrionales bacterium]